ncbi:MAG: TetR/AcrR family transcriptional regulator [Chloroflexota bacterium]|nr:TetR/AcrR family transcriptional regulator [Chloroflexota bacterium]
MTESPRPGPASTRERILAAAAALLATGGREAVSTRAVSVAAGVQAPTIYRLFGDKQGLLDAVAEYGVQQYLASKSEAPVSLDPVEELRRGWDQHVAFGLENPALYALIYGAPRPGPPPPAEQAATAMLARKIQRIAECGRLRVSEALAADLVHALASGATLSLIAMPPSAHRQALAEMAREAAIAAITTAPPAAPAAGAANLAVALRAALPQTSALSGAERRLLQEWLDRIATPGNA